jgi:hypothetical protein
MASVRTTTQHLHDAVEPQRLLNLRACANAISLPFNSTGYEGLGIPIRAN